MMDMQAAKEAYERLEQLSQGYKNGCDFCNTCDFSEASTSVDGEYAHIHLAIGSYRFPKDKQFKFCPVCGRKLKD